MGNEPVCRIFIKHEHITLPTIFQFIEGDGLIFTIHHYSFLNTKQVSQALLCLNIYLGPYSFFSVLKGQRVTKNPFDSSCRTNLLKIVTSSHCISVANTYSLMTTKHSFLNPHFGHKAAIEQFKRAMTPQIYNFILMLKFRFCSYIFQDIQSKSFA